MDKAANSEAAEGNREAIRFWAGLIGLFVAMAVAKIFKADDSAAPVPIEAPPAEPGKRSLEHFENDEPTSEQEHRAWPVQLGQG